MHVYMYAYIEYVLTTYHNDTQYRSVLQPWQEWVYEEYFMVVRMNGLVDVDQY